MASVTLTTFWMHDATDLTSYVDSGGRITETSDSDGQVRRYAGGVYRSIATTGTTENYNIRFLAISRADLALLRSWRGQPVLFRDPVGRKEYGVFYQVNVDDTPHGTITATAYSASIEFVGTSLTEAV